MIATYIPRLATTWLRTLGAGRMHPLGESRLPMRVWPVDVDIYLHLNNGRYLTLMDFGRFHHALRTGMMQTMMARGWKPILGEARVEFLREIRTFRRFELVTRLAAWDEKWFFMEQRFECEGEVHARALVRGVVKQGRKTIPPAELVAALQVDLPSPAPSEELARFMAGERAMG